LARDADVLELIDRAAAAEPGEGHEPRQRDALPSLPHRSLLGPAGFPREPAAEGNQNASAEITSPRPRVLRAWKVGTLIEFFSNPTEPSQSRALTPPGCLLRAAR